MGKGLLEFWQNLKKSWKTAFCAAFFMGLLVHIYKFTNTLLNHDSVYSYYDKLNILGSGRWFLSVACGFSSWFDLPWVNGILSLVFLAVAAVLIVDIFELENPVLILLSSGLLAAFPGVTQTFFYEFTADGYCLAVLLAALGVWLTRMNREKMNNYTEYIYSRMRWVLAAVCLCLSCGIYQAHVSFGMVLALCYLLNELLEHRQNSKTCWRWAFGQLGLYITALAAYYLVWQLCMKVQGIQPSAYKGIDRAALSLRTVLEAIPAVFESLGKFFLEWDVLAYGWTFYGVLNVLFLCCAVLGVPGAVIRSGLWRRKSQLVLFVLAGALVPFAACVWQLLSPDMDYNPMMLISISVVYIFVAVVFERWLAPRWKDLLGLLLAVMVLNFSLQANVGYYFMQRTAEASRATGIELLTRIHLLEEQTRKMYVIGSTQSEVELKNAPNANRIPMLGYALETDLLFDFDHVVLYLNNTFGTNFWALQPEHRPRISAMEEVQAMPCWPEAGSVKLVEDIIVIKLAEETE